jgi:hypothetical protein
MAPDAYGVLLKLETGDYGHTTYATNRTTSDSKSRFDNYRVPDSPNRGGFPCCDYPATKGTINTANTALRLIHKQLWR